MQFAAIQALASYWATDYEWRKIEARMNAYPQFITEIDGLDIHFIHVRSKHETALALIVTHRMARLDHRTDEDYRPADQSHGTGASAADAFHLVIPSMPGYGFSGKPTTTGWNPDRIAKAWARLMARLGYDQYVAQGGDWGAFIQMRWPSRRLQDCWAFTSTTRARFRPHWEGAQGRWSATSRSLG